VSTKFFFFKLKILVFLFRFFFRTEIEEEREFRKIERWNLVDRSKKDNRKVDLGGRMKKAVSSTVFDRGFPWNVGQIPRQGLEVSFSLGSFLKEETKGPRMLLPSCPKTSGITERRDKKKGPEQELKRLQHGNERGPSLYN